MADEIEEEAVVPSGAQEFSAQRSLGVGMGSGDVERQSSQDGEVCRPIILAVAGQIFVEGNIERPMQRVLDTPMRSNDLKHPVGRPAPGEKEVAYDRRFGAAPAFHSGDGGKPGKVVLQGHKPSGYDAGRPDLVAIMSALGGAGQLGRRFGRQGRLGIAQQRRLVGLQRQDVIAAAGADRLALPDGNARRRRSRYTP